MDNKELERIQNELLMEEEEPELIFEEELSLDEILEDEELNGLLRVETEPAFDDPMTIHEPKKPLEYNNFANDYGAPKKDAAAEIRQKDERTVMILMIVASVLCLGIIGILGYWMSILL